jgi:hypothetical protein
LLFLFKKYLNINKYLKLIKRLEKDKQLIKSEIDGLAERVEHVNKGKVKLFKNTDKIHT